MKNKPFFLSIISIVLTIFLFPFSSCTISPVTTASSSSFATAQSETTSSSTPAIVTPDSKYKVQIKNPKEVLESITPVVFSTKYPLDLNYGGNGWDTVDSIISDVSCSDADIGQVSASDLTVITSGDEKAEIEGFLIYTIDGDFLAIYAADQLPQLSKGTYYVVAIMKNEDVIICFKVIQTKEPIKKYFLYEDAENEKGIIVQGNDQIEVPSLLYDYTSIYEKGYIDMCIYTTSQSNLKAYVDKHEEMPIFSSKKDLFHFTEKIMKNHRAFTSSRTPVRMRLNALKASTFHKSNTLKKANITVFLRGAEPADISSE